MASMAAFPVQLGAGSVVAGAGVGVLARVGALVITLADVGDDVAPQPVATPSVPAGRIVMSTQFQNASG